MAGKALGLGLIVLLVCMSQAAERSRPSALAGSWYPDRPAQLKGELDGFLEAAAEQRITPDQPIRALILPHAGYRYSGATAAKGFSLVQGKQYQRVIVLGPSHHSDFRGLSIAEVDAYETPLGSVPLDQYAVQQLRASSLVLADPEAHQREHSIEIELPLLQQTLAPGWKLLPILVGQMEAEDYRQAAALLQPMADNNTLVVVSSDFTHYGARFNYLPFPPDRQAAEHIRQLDEGALERILAKDRDGFLTYQRRTGITICGFRPIRLLIEMLPASSHLQQLAYTTSGALTGDYHNSVSYAVIAVTGPPLSGNSAPPTAKPIESAKLGAEEMLLLHQIAVAGVDLAVGDGQAETRQRLDRLLKQLPPALTAPAGAFVTLKEEGKLRGCIGYIQPRQPLYQAVLENGINAARNDHRFQPVTAEELPRLTIEVSVLTPPRQIASYKDFRVGEQGIVLNKAGQKAVFLPEVATEQGWTREETLARLSRKAGLPSSAWQEGASFQIFENQKYAAPYLP